MWIPLEAIPAWVIAAGMAPAIVALMLWGARAREQGARPLAPAVMPRPPAHVHTYRRASVEETAGVTIAVYRCAECGDITRWETQA